ncbi:TPA: hypothetical protein HA241_07660 [Candidatus Woesearchaeota archaeon]|nr:hypothetical protein [Candidatus Woesearchaeota archaeon]
MAKTQYTGPICFFKMYSEERGSAERKKEINKIGAILEAQASLKKKLSLTGRKYAGRAGSGLTVTFKTGWIRIFIDSRGVEVFSPPVGKPHDHPWLLVRFLVESSYYDTHPDDQLSNIIANVTAIINEKPVYSEYLPGGPLGRNFW